MNVVRLAITFMVALVAAGLLGAVQSLSAQERNTIIHGHDYDYLQLYENEGWRACAKECDRDKRCRAWTFIKPSRQCRLKQRVGKRAQNRCCVSGVTDRVADERKGITRGRIAYIQKDTRFPNRGYCIQMRPTEFRRATLCAHYKKGDSVRLLDRLLLNAHLAKRECLISWEHISGSLRKIVWARCF